MLTFSLSHISFQYDTYLNWLQQSNNSKWPETAEDGDNRHHKIVIRAIAIGNNDSLYSALEVEKGGGGGGEGGIKFTAIYYDKFALYQTSDDWNSHACKIVQQYTINNRLVTTGNCTVQSCLFSSQVLTKNDRMYFNYENIIIFTLKKINNIL